MPYRYAIGPDVSANSRLCDVPLINHASLNGYALTMRVAVTDVPLSRDSEPPRAYRYENQDPLRMRFARPMVRVGDAWIAMDGTDGMPLLTGPIRDWESQLARLGYRKNASDGYEKP